jgi:type VI secretion system secreted protein VgrG
MAGLQEIASALGVFGTGLSQNARMITLATAQDSDLPESLVAERFTGTEAINQLFCFDIDALSTSAELDLDSFIGEEISVKLLLADGGRRAWHGICTEAAWAGADGGVARYRLRLEPALALLRNRRDSYLFQDKTAQDIIIELLADYPQVQARFDITSVLTQHPVWTQQRETDYDFFLRVLADAGLNWRYGHAQDDDKTEPGSSQHWLVIFDSKAQAPDVAGERALRFHGVRASEQRDAIDLFEAARTVQTNAIVTSSWDPQELMAPSAEIESNLSAGELPTLAHHNGSGERRHLGQDAPEQHALRMLQWFELENKCFSGAGAVRQLAAGHTFQLTQHSQFGDDCFVVTSVHHAARNNIDTAIKHSRADALQDATYRNIFTCVRDSVAIVPRPSVRKTASGMQPALVVGLPSAVATSTRDHQVKVQFGWQRGTAPNPGGIEHDTDPNGNASGDDASGAWVRVSEALAGPNWGSQFVPRIGTEVLVDFIDGDINRPVVVAQLYTGEDAPPYSAGIDAAANHPGVLSGIHTHNFDGDGFNQWQLDDTQGQVRMRLATSQASTELNLGYLISQPVGSLQRGNYRGSGFECRTDAWAVLRGGAGVLMSCTPRSGNEVGVTSTQCDAAEALGQLGGSHQLRDVLSDAATQQSALVSKDAGAAEDALLALLDPAKKGKVSGSVNGHVALKPRGDSRDLDAAAPVEKLGEPLVFMETPSNVNWAAPASTAVFAAHEMSWTAQSDLHFAAAQTISLASLKASGLFAHSGGIQAFAGNGPLSLQAHSDQLEILADKAISIISAKDAIAINAKEKIVLQAGQSSITLEGGNITFACPGNFSVQSGKHLFDSGASKNADIAGLPRGLATTNSSGAPQLSQFDEQIVFKDSHGEAIADMPFHVTNKAEATQKVTDKSPIDGALDRLATPKAEPLEYALRYATFKFNK